MKLTEFLPRLARSLPDERLKPANRREALLNLTGAIALLLFGNLLADWFLTYLTSNRGYFLVSRKWEILSEIQQPVDWLVLGDSSCNQGVVPELLSENLGGTALNLCTVGSLLSLDDAWMLEHHIRRVGPPKHVVLVHVYDIWHREIEEETIAHLAQIPLDPEDIATFDPPMNLNQEDQIKLFLHRYFPLYSSNETLSDWIREPIQSFQESREFTVTDRGFMPMSRAYPYGVLRDAQRHLRSVRSQPVALSEINQQSLTKIASLAEQYDFEVYLAPSPIYEGLHQDQEFRQHFRRTHRKLEDFVSKSDRFHLVMSQPTTFDETQMRNADHVIASAAEIYTKRLASMIAAEQAKSR